MLNAGSQLGEGKSASLRCWHMHGKTGGRGVHALVRMVDTSAGMVGWLMLRDTEKVGVAGEHG
jgi:hypothetical protein